MNSFPIVDVSSWPIASNEPAGNDEKAWLEDDDGILWLFKPRKEHEDWNQGEDWAEKAASEIAISLCVPAAHIELATRYSKHGLISRDLTPSGGELQPGEVLLSGLLESFDPKDKLRRGHNLANIQAALVDFSPPHDTNTDLAMSAFGVFAGYLMLDALIANQDRHSENWGVIRPSGEDDPDQLAGSFDHASSLAFNLQDSKRQRLLTSDDMEAFAHRAQAQRFEHARPKHAVSLVSFADEALQMAGDTVRSFWFDSLGTLSKGSLATLLDQLPVMSELSRTFAVELLDINRRRLLDAYADTR